MVASQALWFVVCWVQGREVESGANADRRLPQRPMIM